MKWKLPKLNNPVWLTVGAVVLPWGLGWQIPAQAAVIFTGNGTNPATGNSIAAEAIFEVMGNQLTVTLTNTAQDDPDRSSEVLTALFFGLDNLTNSQLDALTLDSVVLSDDSVVLLDGVVQPTPIDITAPPPPTNNQGANFQGGWSLPNEPQNIPGNANTGLGTAGLDVFNGNAVNRPGQGGNFNYGLVSSAYTTDGDNNPMGSAELIQDSVIFTIDNLPDGFTEDRISNVLFQYGTDQASEPSIPGVPRQEIPEPSSVLGLIAMVGGLAVSRRRQ